MNSKSMSVLVVVVFLFGLAYLSFAAEGSKTAAVKGSITKIEGNMVTVQDKTGKETTVKVKDVSGLQVSDTVKIKDGVAKKMTVKSESGKSQKSEMPTKSGY